MNDFLEFINNAEKEALLTLPGSNSELVEKLIDARPFHSLEELSAISSLTPELLANWQKEVNSSEESEGEQESELVVENVNPPSESNPPEPAKNRTAHTLVTILIVVVILAGLAAAAYFGIPYFYKRILNPLESNTTRVSELAATQSADVKRLEGEITALHTQVASLELRADAIEQSIDAHTANLKTLEKMQSTLQANMNTQKSDLLAQMDEQLTLTRSLELLGRSRLYLSQSNYGLAQTDISEARSLLYSLLAVIPADELDGLKVVISRLDLALQNLPEYPVVAVYDVDIAWKLLVDGLPSVPLMAVTPFVAAPSPVPQGTPVLGMTPTP